VSSIARSPKTVGAKREPQPERQAADTIARLQRGILRLALAYHGRNPDLDRKLKEFGALVRSGGRQVDRQPLIDEIVNTIVSLDLAPKQAAPASATTSAPSRDIHEFIDYLVVPDSLRPEIEKAQRLLAQARDRSAMLAHVKHLAETLSQNLSRAPAGSADPAAIRMLLIEMLERIPVSLALVSKVSPLRRAIESADHIDTFVGCVGDIAALVGDLQAELRGELEHQGKFLRDTELRLREFEHFVQHSHDLHAETSTDSLQLSDTINGELETLRSDAAAASDLEEIQDLIASRLDNISSGLNTFVASQKVRALEANESIDSMKERLRELEVQSEHLRKDLEQQHARVLIDPLTGVLNRLGYIETANKQVARWKRHGGALSLGVLDLDLFKRINDDYGHIAGDRVLSTVANKLNEITRESDILCRFGGEEFVLLLPETTAPQAFVLLEKLREHIEQCPFRHKDTPVKVTISCGVAEFRPGDTLDAVFERADRAMYLAKANGRNSVRLASVDDVDQAPDQLPAR